jgi:putative transposase
MVATPEQYRWSSCRYRLGQESCEWLDHDPCYLALGTNENERRKRYRQYLQEAIPVGEWRLMRDAVQRGQLTGAGRFVEKVEAILGKRIEHRSRGRPSSMRKDSHEQTVK